MATYQYLDCTFEDGVILGKTSTIPVSLWGVTPGSQYAAISTVANTAPVNASTSSSPWAYSSSAQALAIITAVNSCIAAMQNVGIIAGKAVIAAQ